MARRTRSRLPTMLGELALASAETIARRAVLMASGRCTRAELRRMVTEKLKATRQTGFAAMSPRAGTKALLTPWHRAARRNAKRLRRTR